MKLVLLVWVSVVNVKSRWLGIWRLYIKSRYPFHNVWIKLDENWKPDALMNGTTVLGSLKTIENAFDVKLSLPQIISRYNDWWFRMMWIKTLIGSAAANVFSSFLFSLGCPMNADLFYVCLFALPSCPAFPPTLHKCAPNKDDTQIVGKRWMETKKRWMDDLEKNQQWFCKKHGKRKR